MAVIVHVPKMTRGFEPTCPSCGHAEQKVKVCKNCKHEYPAPSKRGKDFLIWFVVVVGCWAFITVVFWIAEVLAPSHGGEEKKITLLTVIGQEWNCLVKLAHHIF